MNSVKKMGRYRALLILLILLFGCGWGANQEPGAEQNHRKSEGARRENSSQMDAQISPSHQYTDSLSSFEEFAQRLLNQPVNGIWFDNSATWFHDHFGPERARQLSDDYQSNCRKLEETLESIRNAEDEEPRDIHVQMTSEAIDLNASGLQNAALQQMKQKTPLFAIVLRRPDKEDLRLQSFVFAEGTFRFAGFMRVFGTDHAEYASETLYRYPLQEFGEILQDKGLIDQPAVDYLRQQGVLR